MFICPPRAYTEDGLETISEMTCCKPVIAPAHTHLTTLGAGKVE